MHASAPNRLALTIAMTIALCLGLLSLTGCPDNGGDRPDGASLLLSDAGSLQNPCVSPDGSQAVVTRYADGYGEGLAALWTVDLESGDAGVLLEDEFRNVVHTGSCWSDATGDIVFASDREDGRWELYRLDPVTGERDRITERAGFDATEASWSASGDWVLFTSRPEGDAGAAGTVTKVRPDGSDEAVLTPAGADDRHPVASPAANLAVLETWDGESWTLVMTDLSGELREALTDAAGDDRQPSWSWDGEVVIFSSDRDGQAQPDLYTVKIEGCEISRFSEDEGYDGAPAYTPSDGYVLFETVVEGAPREEGTELWFLPAPST